MARPAWLDRLLLALAAVACAILGGCAAPKLAGTNDAQLEYAVAADPTTGKRVDPAVAAAGVKGRLVSAQVMADVDALEDGHVRVVVDADIAGAVDDLLAWRGGLRAAQVDDAAPPAELRARVADLPLIVDLGRGDAAITSIAPVARGRALALGLSPEARAPLEAFAREHPGGRVAFARGRVFLQAMPAAQAAATPLVLRFGDDLPAYTRAYRARLLLRSPILPPLQRTSAAPLAPRWGLAAACALLPFALSFAWLFFVRRFDRARPEPMWLVASTFALGELAIVPAALAEMGLAWLSPWLDTSLVTLGGQAWALPLSIPVLSLTVGAVEEGAKLAATWALARRRPEFDEPVDGIVYACAASLGFAAVENVKYFALGRMSGAVIAMRAFETVPAHMFFSAIWGYAMGRKLVSRRSRVWPMFALSALAHGTFDAAASTDGTQWLATLLVLVLGAAFVVMLRRALRHGPVRVRSPFDDAPPTERMPLSAMPRTFVRVGSRAAFLGCAAAMLACALALTVLGMAFELLHHRVGPVFVTLATGMLAAFGLAAYGASSTLPLDVAIDLEGITFAGALTRWAAIAGFTVEARGGRAVVRVDTPRGPVRIGPARPESARAIVEAIEASRAAP